MAAPLINILTGNSIQYLGTPWPSGQIPSGVPGWNLSAKLASLRAQFGFNSESHLFELDFIPEGSGHGHGASGQLAPLNTTIEMQISGFYIKGNISHIDWVSAENGTVLTVSLRDKRAILDQYKITTDDLGSGVPSGVVSVPRQWRITNGLTTNVARTWPACTSGNVSVVNTEADDPNFLEYVRIIEEGATYPQIWAAIDSQLGSGVSSKLPSIASIQSNIGGDINSLRFKFGMDKLREVISKVTFETAFDWYWNMSSETVSLINKKTPFIIPEVEILTLINAYGGSGIDNVKRISYGKDLIEEPSRVHLLGAHQEGMMNSALLSPIDGLDTIYDGLTPSSTLVFRPAWHLLTVGFYDASGYYRTYVPTSKELQMALAGEEQWTYFKKYQTNSAPSGWGLPSDAGNIAAQHPDFQSRLDPRQPLAEILSNPSGNIRVINNRRDLASNWVNEFYGRVFQHAGRHYGKSYVATNALTHGDRVFTLLDRAWCNVENQREIPSGLFVDDYEISRQYGPIAPFFGADAKVSSYVKLPSGTVYGPLGEDTPTSFGNWTEDAVPFNPSGDGSHYIPVDLRIVGARVQDPRRDENFSFESFPEQTILCQLPEIAASGLVRDDILGNLATLTEFGLSLQQSGIIDLIDPRMIVVPYNCLSGVAIPVQATERYGQIYPSTWASGNSHPIYGTNVEVDDNLAPWVEFPEGTQTSVTKLDNRAFDKISAVMVDQSESQYLEIIQVGLPALSFDSFAVQTPNASGLIGEREHGVTSVSIDYGENGLTTNYKIQSYFTNLARPIPFANRTRFKINGVLNPIDFTDLGRFLTSFGPGNGNGGAARGVGNNTSLLNFDFERQESCTVIAIHHIFDADACARLMNGHTIPTEERYFAVVNRRRSFVYGQTNYTLENGINRVGHNLNSLQVTVNFIQSGVGQIALPSIELDNFTVAVSNNTGNNIVGTLLIYNGEGDVRPTNGTIRRSEEVDDYGAVCQDGYLNLDDPCTYVHKRVDGEELAYFLGGRPLNPGTIVQVEQIQNTTPVRYNVSILGDRHGRWIYNLRTLNDVPVATGFQSPIAGNGT